MIEESYQIAKDILMNKKEDLIKLAELLLSKEIIFKADIEKILGNRSPSNKVMVPANGTFK